MGFTVAIWSFNCYKDLLLKLITVLELRKYNNLRNTKLTEL